MEQRTDEWFQARLGKVTASKVSDVMAKGRGNTPSATRANYMAQLAAERLTGTPPENFTNAAMQWGTDHEDEARAAYEFLTDCEVELVAFVDHPLIEKTGASPDGLVGSRGLVEIKCPNTATHIKTLLGGSIDGKYLKQMHLQMMCCERDWCDFVSYDPRLPAEMQLHVERVERDESLVDAIVQALIPFHAELDEMVDSLRAKFLA